MHDNIKKELEKIYIIQPITRENESKYHVLHDEAVALIESAGAVYTGTIYQKIREVNAATFIGEGKLQELSEILYGLDGITVLFNGELSPSQTLNISSALNDRKVIDRTTLILDIFAKNARSGEGKLQVELAQLKYTAPRLVGKGIALSRQEGRIGTRGPGESKLETDRRHLKERLYALEKQLKELEQKRLVMRASRDKSGIPKVGIVGYTNAGKSTLLNALTDAGVLSEDKLFATLDATTRRMTLPNGENILLTDTVGFIRKLPHHLIRAFKSTLDEVAYSDILLVVADAGDPELDEHLAVTRELISELGAGEKPIICVYNKCDMLERWPESNLESPNSVFVSAATGKGLDSFSKTLEKVIAENKKVAELLIPYAEQSKLSQLYAVAQILSVEYQDDGIAVSARMDTKVAGQYAKYKR